MYRRPRPLVALLDGADDLVLFLVERVGDHHLQAGAISMAQ